MAVGLPGGSATRLSDMWVIPAEKLGWRNKFGCHLYVDSVCSLVHGWDYPGRAFVMIKQAGREFKSDLTNINCDVGTNKNIYTLNNEFTPLASTMCNILFKVLNDQKIKVQ